MTSDPDHTLLRLARSCHSTAAGGATTSSLQTRPLRGISQGVGGSSAIHFLLPIAQANLGVEMRCCIILMCIMCMCMFVYIYIYQIERERYIIYRECGIDCTQYQCKSLEPLLSLILFQQFSICIYIIIYIQLYIYYCIHAISTTIVPPKKWLLSGNLTQLLEMAIYS